MEAILWVVVRNQVQKYSARFEHGEGRSGVVEDGGDTPVGVDGEEGRGLLLVGAEVDVGGSVWDAEFFEEDGDFLAVAGGLVRG
jgi:hypothetical protein